MSSSILALLANTLWAIVLVIWVVSYRAVLILGGKKRVNEFPASGDNSDKPFYSRLLRAHANTMENLPLFAVVIIAAVLLNDTSLSDSLAWVLVGARIAQSVVHLTSTSELAVWIRFCLFAVQMGVLLGIMAGLVVNA